MKDLELLELAAKANGGEFHSGHFSSDGREWEEWNPLIDDGDALRLAVKMNMSIMRDYGRDAVQVSTDDGGDSFTAFALEGDNEDPYAATRRAIVRAAAEIGKATSPHAERV